MTLNFSSFFFNETYSVIDQKAIYKQLVLQVTYQIKESFRLFAFCVLYLIMRILFYEKLKVNSTVNLIVSISDGFVFFYVGYYLILFLRLMS